MFSEAHPLSREGEVDRTAKVSRRPQVSGVRLGSGRKKTQVREVGVPHILNPVEEAVCSPL